MQAVHNGFGRTWRRRRAAAGRDEEITEGEIRGEGRRRVNWDCGRGE